ncbi:MAG: PAS domain S-box protein [Alphaproteobacteria bacterium]|nr:MAG: PAS domain S-box protein [Alphaproteobacteria bacterium]
MLFDLSLFSTDFMPHGYCFLWAPEILWMHVGADAAIALAYFSIPLSLLAMLKQRKDIKFSPIFYMFSAFIFLCGVTHVMNIVTVWHGTYGLSGLAKVATAIISVITAIAAWRLIPLVVAIPSQRQLEEKVAERTAELERKSAQLELVINKISPAIIGVDRKGHIRLVNPAATDLFDAKREELIGQPIETLVPESVRAKHPEHRRNFFANMQTRPMGQGMELYAQKLSGDLFPVEIGLTPVHGDPDLVVLATIVDISERLRTAADRRRMAAIIESSDDAIFSTDLQGYIQSWNPGAEKLLGYRAKEAVSWPMSIIIPDGETEEMPYILQEVRRGMAVNHHETRYCRKDGSLVDVSLSISPVRNPQGQTVGAAIIARDITDTKAKENELRQLNVKLARSNEALDQFVYIAAHDLKEPLRGIHNLSSIVIEDCMERLEDEHQEDLRTIATLTERMERLIDDLRDYSRIDRRKKEHDLIDCREAIEQVAEDMHGWAEDDHLVIKIAADIPDAKFSQVHLTTVFRNLISNAIKYNEAAEKRVEIAGKRTGDFVEFSVSDNGIGIEPDFQGRVFEMFRRFHGSSQYGGGTGAGLAIVKRIVEQHGGQITVESEPGEGTTFRFTMTVAKENGL